MSIQPLIEDLFSVSDQLIAAMEQEIDYLKSQRLDEMSGLQAEKNALSMHYQQVMTDLMIRGEELKALSDTDRQAIRDAQAKFKRTARRNISAIRSRMMVAQRLIDTVVDALKDREAVTNGIYNRYGTIGPALGDEQSGIGGVPRLNVSVDQRL